MNYHIKSLCHQGAIRSNNEDAISYGINNSLGIVWMLVADGMGGHNAGEVASAMLVEHISERFDMLTEVEVPDWGKWMISLFNSANITILDTAKRNVTQQGMGTTGVLIVIDDKECHIGWVGDSRAYTLKLNKLAQETVDHTMVQELVNKGAISAETAKKANTKNLLSQAIGVREKIAVDTVTIEINEGDTLMLSTDGLHDFLTEQEIKQHLSEFSIDNDVCHTMVNQAIEQHSRDNLTLGLISLTRHTLVIN